MSTEAPADLLSRRYGAPRGTRRRGRRFWLGLLAVTTLLAGAFAAWIAVAGGAAPTSKDVGFQVVSEAEVTADFEVTRRAGDVVTCAVQALNDKYAPVGWTELTVGPASTDGPGGSVTSSHRVAVRTTNLATTAVVDSCWVEDDAAT